MMRINYNAGIISENKCREMFLIIHKKLQHICGFFDNTINKINNMKPKILKTNAVKKPEIPVDIVNVLLLQFLS
jgi:hypothetical protein